MSSCVPGRLARRRRKEKQLDHVAFNVTGVAEFRRRLLDYGAHFDEQNVPDAGFQLFLRDPVGNRSN